MAADYDHCEDFIAKDNPRLNSVRVGTGAFILVQGGGRKVHLTFARPNMEYFKMRKIILKKGEDKENSQ